MSEPETPIPSEAPAASGPDPVAAGAAPALPAPEEAEAGPVLSRTPGWVPGAVVAGAVLVLLGFVVLEVRLAPEGEDAASFVSDLGKVLIFLGGLSLVSGYFGYLLSRVPLAAAFEALLLTMVTASSYLLGAGILLSSLAGDAGSLFFVQWFDLSGKGAAVAAIAGGVVCAGAFCAGFWLTARIVWPYFRAGVALNVILMVHLVVGVLGVVSFLNDRFTPTLLGTGIDLTETGRFTLSDRTRAVLDKMEGDLKAILLDYRDLRRMQPSSRSRQLDDVTSRVQGLLREFRAASSRVEESLVNPVREPQEVDRAFRELRMEESMPSVTGEEDVLLLAYRPPGEKVWARTRLVRLNHEFLDTSSLGTPRFRGEGILANAVNEVVFVQRRVYFLAGHNEKSLDPVAPTQTVSALAEALRGDNFAVSTLDLSRDAGIPLDADLLVLAGPQQPLRPPEVEAVRGYLARGGALLVLVDPVDPGADAATGLEEVLASYGIQTRRDAVIVSYVVERILRGTVPNAVLHLFLGKEETGRHPAMEALSRQGSFTLAFDRVSPVFKAEKTPPGVEAHELLYAPRDIDGYRPFGLVGRVDRPGGVEPQEGDITDRRLPVGIAAEKAEGEAGKGGGRVVVFGDSDFASDLRLHPTSRAAAPANRTLLLNVVSWAVRRDLIAIDPKTVETERVVLRKEDAALAFWVTVVALPLVVLGLAVGVWWTRRR